MEGVDTLDVVKMGSVKLWTSLDPDWRAASIRAAYRWTELREDIADIAEDMGVGENTAFLLICAAVAMKCRLDKQA